MRWRYDTPPSDPYKRYLVVFCPWDYNLQEHAVHYISFDIASYFTGDGTYQDRPWHLSVTHSVMEKEILAWADVGDAKDFIYKARREPKPCPICGRKPVRKQLHFKVGEGENRWDNEHHEDGSLKWTWLECENCGIGTQAYCYEHQATDLWNAGKYEVNDEKTDDSGCNEG